MSRRVLVWTNALLVLALAGLLVVSIGRERGTRPVAVHPDPTRVPLSGVAPSRENVAPGFREQVELLEHRLAAAAADTTALLGLARLYQDAHQPVVAAGYYHRYLEHAPANRQAWLDLADVNAASGDWDGALAATTTLLARDSLDPAALFNRGAIHANRGQLAEARSWWQKAASQTRDRAVAVQAADAMRRLSMRP